MPTYDSPWKDLLYHYLRLALLLLFPRLAARIDWREDYEPLEQELRKIAPEAGEGVRYADALIKVYLLSGDHRILHAEVQAQKQDDFGRRVYVYNYLAFDHFRDPPESLVILGDDDPDWRPTSYEVKLDYSTMTFAFEPIKLLDWANRTDELKAHENPVAVFVLAHLEAMRSAGNLEEAAKAKLDLLRNLLARKLDGEDTRRFERYLDFFFSDLSAEAAERIYQEATQMSTQEKPSFATLIPTSERYGRKQGAIEGRLEG